MMTTSLLHCINMHLNRLSVYPISQEEQQTNNWNFCSLHQKIRLEKIHTQAVSMYILSFS